MKLNLKKKNTDGAKHFSKKKLVRKHKRDAQTNDITSGLVKKAPIKEEADYSLRNKSSFKDGLHAHRGFTHIHISPVKLQKPYLIRLHLV